MTFWPQPWPCLDLASFLELSISLLSPHHFTVKSVPVVVTHDGRTIRYPDPSIAVGDTVKIDLATGKIADYIKLDVGVQVIVTGGRNTGRVGTLVHRERHPGTFDIVHVKDAAGHEVCTK